MIETRTFLAALATDALFSDLFSGPHPVRAVGAAIRACDRCAMRFGIRGDAFAGRIAGVLTVAAVGGIAYLSAAIPARGRSCFARAATLALGASALSWRSLITHVQAVDSALAKHDLPAARKSVSRIVGRDTEQLDQTGIARAAIETLAESFCDGIVAPMLYLVIGGVPAAMAYKAVNTMDSMIGHIEPPYRYFGWCAARTDDVANFIPARISAAAIACAAYLFGENGARAVHVCLRDARLHRSPNAGWPESALAGALGVRLGGVNLYDGVITPGAVLGREFSAPGSGDVPRAMRVITLATGVAAAAAIAILLVRDAFA